MFPEISLGPFKIEYPDSYPTLLIGFLLILGLGYKFVYPKIRDLLKARQERIAQAQAQADALLAEAQAIHDEYAHRLAHIEEEHRARVEQAVKEADVLSAQIIAEAQQAAQAILQRTQEEIERERAYHQVLLRQQIVQIVLNAAEQAIRERTSEEAQHKLVREFVQQLALTASNGLSFAGRNGLVRNGEEE